MPPIGTVENQQYFEGIIKFTEIQIKLRRTVEPLIGAGNVVKWLINCKAVRSFPERHENMCFWRCLAASFKIREGSIDTRLLEGAAKSLAKRCLGRTHLLKKVSMETISNAAQTMNITITIYNPTWQNGAVVCELRDKFGTGEQIMSIGIVEGHCYLIKDLEGLCKIWRCSKCGVAFNRASNLKRHKYEVDFSPEPKVICEGKRVEGIASYSDKVFYGTRSGISIKTARWIASQGAPHGRSPPSGGATRDDKLSPRLASRHIHHAFCGHGGERTLEVRGKKIRVDCYEPATGTVYQYHGCYWHGCPCVGGGDEETLSKTLEIDAAIAEKHPMVVAW